MLRLMRVWEHVYWESFDENKLKSLLHIKESEKIRLVVCVGYPTTDDIRDKKRKDMDEIVEYFGS